MAERTVDSNWARRRNLIKQYWRLFAKRMRRVWTRGSATVLKVRTALYQQLPPALIEGSALYNKLPTPTSIRLLRLDLKDPLSCTLRTFDLDPKDGEAQIPSYDALSYTWGPPRRLDLCPFCGVQQFPQPEGADCCLGCGAERGPQDDPWHVREASETELLINGHKKHVTDSLFDALISICGRHLDRAKRTAFRQRLATSDSRNLPEDDVHWTFESWLWVDAICINQDDLSERASQVRLMGRVYTNAASTVIWLGEDDGTTLEALSLMKTIAQAPDVAEGTLRNVDWRSVQAVANLYSLHWWKRLWIMQETVLARRLKPIRGAFDISWQLLMTIADFFRDPDRPSLRSLELQMRYTIATCDVEMLGFMRNEYWNLTHWQGLQFCSLLWLPQSRACGEPRDCIFALLGLSRAHPAAIYKAIGYDAPVATVFAAATRIMLQESGSLLFLSMAGQQQLDGGRSIPHLPSWVPNYHSHALKPKPIRNTTVKSGEGRQERELSDYANFDGEPSNGLLLDLRVYLRCNIDSACDSWSCYPYFATRNWLEMTSRVTFPHSDGASELQVLMWTVMGGQLKLGDMLDELPPVLLRFIGGVFAKIIEPKASDSESENVGTLEWFQKGEWGKLKLPSLDFGAGSTSDASREVAKLQSALTPEQWDRYVPSAGQDVFEAVQSQIRQKRLFVTDTGWLGLGPFDLQHGDQICTAPGSDVPLILRRRPSGRFRYVGQAYVYGMMPGREFPLKGGLETITLE